MANSLSPTVSTISTSAENWPRVPLTLDPRAKNLGLLKRCNFCYDSSMRVTLDVPDRIAEALCLNGRDVERRVLEMLVLDGYRTGELSRGEVSEMLSLSFQETEEFLHRSGAELGLSVTEYEQEAEALQQALGR